jgi:biotin carboxylase
VVKPVDGSASWDVKLVTDEAGLLEALEQHRRRETYGRGVRPKGLVLIEQYIEGALWSAEGFSNNGDVDIWGYSDRILGPPPHFVEIELTFSAECPDARAAEFVQAVLKATRYDFGPFHVEFIASPSGPQLVELNPRIIGAGAHTCLDLACHASVVDSVMARFLLREPGDLTPTRASTHREIFVDRLGIVTQVRGAHQARMLPGVHAVEIRARRGSEVRPPTSNSDSLGFIITTGSTARLSAGRAREAASMITVEFGKMPLEFRT